jgi:hypothetical protein
MHLVASLVSSIDEYLGDAQTCCRLRKTCPELRSYLPREARVFASSLARFRYFPKDEFLIIMDVSLIWFCREGSADYSYGLESLRGTFAHPRGFNSQPFECRERCLAALLKNALVEEARRVCPAHDDLLLVAIGAAEVDIFVFLVDAAISGEHNFSCELFDKMIQCGRLDLLQCMEERSLISEHPDSSSLIPCAILFRKLEILKYLMDDVGIRARISSYDLRFCRDLPTIRFLHSRSVNIGKIMDLNQVVEGPIDQEDESIETIEFLLSVGVGIDAFGEGERESPLGKALRSNQLRIARFLLERGADPNCPRGYCPLGRCVSVEGINLLVEFGAVYAPDALGKTPISYALMRLGDTYAALEELSRCIRRFQELGGEINEISKEYGTILHFILSSSWANMNDLSYMRFLLDQCPELITTRNSQGVLPLDLPRTRFHQPARQYIIDYMSEE